MPDSGTKPPDAQRNTVRAGTQDPFKKDAADQASERAKGEAKRPADAPSGGRRLRGDSGSGGSGGGRAYEGTSTFKDYQYRQANKIDEESK